MARTAIPRNGRQLQLRATILRSSMARNSPVHTPKPPRDGGRLLAQILCLVFGLLGAVPLAVGLLVRTDLVHSWAARQTAALLERELGIVAHYRVVVQAWPFAVGLSDVVVESNDGGAPALQAAKISLRPRLFGLLAGQFDAGNIEIDAPRLRVVVREGKLTNVQYKLPASAPAPRSSRHAPFRAIAITDAALDAELDGVQLKARDIDVDVASEEGPVYEIAVRAGEQLLVRTRPVFSVGPDAGQEPAIDEDVICRFDGRVRWSKSSLLVRRLAVSAAADDDARPGTAPSCSLPEGDPRRIEITLAHVQTPWPISDHPDVEGAVKVRTPLSLVNRLLPFPPLKGFVTVDVEGRYQKSLRLPVLRGKVEGSGIELDVYRLMSELSADIAIDGEGIRSESASVGFGYGTITLHEVAVEPLKKGAPIRIGSVDAVNIGFPAMMRDLDVTQHAHVQWQFRSTHVGTVEGTLAPLRLDGEFTGHTSDFEVFDSAVDDPARHHMIGVKEAKLSGHVAARPEAEQVNNPHADLGDSDLEASGWRGCHNDISLVVAPSSRLDLANISPLAKLKLGGRAQVSAQMTGKFNNPLLTGQLAVAGLSLD